MTLAPVDIAFIMPVSEVYGSLFVSIAFLGSKHTMSPVLGILESNRSGMNSKCLRGRFERPLINQGRRVVDTGFGTCIDFACEYDFAHELQIPSAVGLRSAFDLYRRGSDSGLH
jgi:hypothetical protein